MRTLPGHTANAFSISAKSEYLIANTPLIYFIKEISLVEEIIVTKRVIQEIFVVIRGPRDKTAALEGEYYYSGEV